MDQQHHLCNFERISHWGPQAEAEISSKWVLASCDVIPYDADNRYAWYYQYYEYFLQIWNLSRIAHHTVYQSVAFICGKLQVTWKIHRIWLDNKYTWKFHGIWLDNKYWAAIPQLLSSQKSSSICETKWWQVLVDPHHVHIVNMRLSHRPTIAGTVPQCIQSNLKELSQLFLWSFC